MSNYDPLDQAGQDKARNQSRTREKLAESTDIEDVKWMMANPRGRRLVWHILDRANLFASSFNTNSMTMARDEGAKSEARRWQILTLCHCADLYTLMLKESGK
jgi:hypothetical protein